MTLNWAIAATMLTVCGGLLGAFTWYVRVIVREEIQALDKRFVPRELYNERGADLDRRFEQLEKHVAWRP